MLQRFLQYNNKYALISEEDELLLAVSGGVDSMVLWHLVEELGFKYKLAHSNFGLRGVESDADEALIRQKAKALGRSVFVKTFETEEYAKAEKISIQMAARELRYNWFRELMTNEGCNKLLTAHHLNDSVETVFLNQVRGTSILGLSGIKAINQDIIRPLVSFSKEEIIAFAEEAKIEWREDRSNDSIDYKRNFIRKEVVPKLTELNPGFLNTFAINMRKNEEVEALFRLHVETLRSSLLKQEGERYEISIPELKKSLAGPLALQFLLEDFAFNYNQAESILDALEQVGAVFQTATHKLWVDREKLILEPILEKETPRDRQVNNIHELSTLLTDFKVIILEAPFDIDKSPNNVMLDFDRLSFPLLIRSWQKGDKIKPLGMSNYKLISDLLIDTKVPSPLKSKFQLMLSEGKIVALLGLRVSDDFKVTPSTNRVLHLVRAKE